MLVIDGQHLRLANAYGPELLLHARCWAELLASDHAAEYVKELVDRARSYEFEPNGKTDDYGRAYGLVSIDGADLGDILYDQGLAARPSDAALRLVPADQPEGRRRARSSPASINVGTEQRKSPSGGRRGCQSSAACADQPTMSASVKNWAISSLAFSWLSEPWTEFSPIDWAKSLRMVPSAALAGLVAPMTSRYLATALSPSSTCTTTGAGDHELDQFAEERALRVDFVELLGLGVGSCWMRRWATMRRPASSITALILPVRLRRGGVGLDDREGAFGHGESILLELGV